MTSPKKLVANRRNAKKSTGPRTAAGKLASSTNALRHGLLSALPVLPCVESAEAWEAHRGAVVAALAPVGYVETTLAGRVASLMWRLERVIRYETEHAASGIETAQEELEEHRQRMAEFERDIVADGITREQIAEVVALRGEAFRAFARLRDAADNDPIANDDAEAILDAVTDGDGFEPDEGEGAPWTKRTLIESVADLDEDPNALACAEARAKGEADKIAKALRDFDAKVTRKVRERLLLPAEEREMTGRYEAHLDRSLFKTLRELQRLQALRAADARAVPLALDVDLSVGRRDDVRDEGEP